MVKFTNWFLLTSQRRFFIDFVALICQLSPLYLFLRAFLELVHYTAVTFNNLDFNNLEQSILHQSVLLPFFCGE